MISRAFLVGALAALGIVFSCSMLYLLGHGAWLSRARQRTHRQLARGRTVMSGVVTTGAMTHVEVETIRALPRHIRSRLFAELSRSFGGAVRDRVRETASAVGTIEDAERRLRSRFWWRRLGAARTLTALGASESLILPLLRDRHPAVRAQVAEWAADHPEPEILRALLKVLSSKDALSRFAVQDALLRVGHAATVPLAEYLASHDGPETIPALEVAATLVDPMLTRATLPLCSSPHSLVRARAAEVLGGGGGEQVIDQLSTMLSDADPGVRAAAARSLARLRHWPAAASLAGLLHDPVWGVRRTAGLSLLALGGPGILFLRRCLRDGDPFAAEMAAHVLDLPPVASEALA